MVLNISISPEAEAKLRARAAEAGLDASSYAARVVEKAVSEPTLDEVLAPLRAEVAASGMSDEELDALLEEAKHEMRRERRTQRGK